MLPEILVCTQVGQEGIDLHRYCRHVIHYDLWWNPASVEQRTGRVDRIGSSAVRERSRVLEERGVEDLPEDELPGLDIGLPYLAGTYDERTFERLRTRAQVFDILTGGEPTADEDPDPESYVEEPEAEAEALRHLTLPASLLDDLRVRLEAGIGSRR